jgi:hypothetical protein
MGRFICSCCTNPKMEVFEVESGLMPPMRLLLCKRCRDEDHEPRYAIILAGRSGSRAAGKIAKQRKYCGSFITLEEMAA